MTIKLEAAFHEAGHAVAAWYSRFHSVVGPIRLANYGAGEAYISLSKSKTQAVGITPSEALRTDPDVVKDLAVVLVAGLAAEKIAAELNPDLTPNEECAKPDYNLLHQMLGGARLSKKTDRYEGLARDLLTSRWVIVEGLATRLFNEGAMSPVDIHEHLEVEAAV